MNSVEKVKAICKERKIAISRLEKDLGYANGYIGQLRKGTFPNDRLVEIANYLGISTAYLSGENENKPTTAGELDKDTMELLDLAHSLGEDDRALLLSMARELKKRKTRQGE